MNIKTVISTHAINLFSEWNKVVRELSQHFVKYLQYYENLLSHLFEKDSHTFHIICATYMYMMSNIVFCTVRWDSYY